MKFKNYLFSMTITIILLIMLEIISTAILPSFGLANFKLMFNILIILYLGFNLESPVVPILILIVQLFHSAFSIDGWATGTVAGVIICILISYLKELLDFSNALSTIIVTQIFQLFWFLISAALIYLRTDSFSFVVSRFWSFIPESITLSLLSPFFFNLMHKFWKIDQKSAGVEI